jgi:alpha-galactosidase
LLVGGAGAGAFNDPDMLEVGVNGTFFNLPLAPAAWLDDIQARSHFSLWAIMAAPLITGNDLRVRPFSVLAYFFVCAKPDMSVSIHHQTMTPAIQAILTNAEVIAVNQDPLGLQGRVMASVQSGLDLDGGTHM